MQIMKFPEDVRGYYEKIDKNDPYRLQFEGLFRRDVVLSDSSAAYYVYIPQGAHYAGRAVLAVMDDGDKPESFLESTGWRQLADAESIVVLLAEAGQCSEYYEEFFKARRDEQYYTVNKATCYLAGYGTGSAVVIREALRHPSVWAGVLCCGDFGIAREELQEIGGKASDVDFIKKCSIPVPAWLWTENMTKEQENVAEYLKDADRSEYKENAGDSTEHYHPKRAVIDSLIDEQAGADLYVTRASQEQCRRPESTERIWKCLLSRSIRPVAIYNGNLRPYRSIQDWEADERTMELGAYRREWTEYIPSVARREPDRAVPLVVCFHGGNNNGFSAMYRTEWIKVAEARGFAVVFPTGAMRRRDDKNAVPHPAWNACGATDIEDDVAFVRALIEDVKGRYAIDASRIYATGHSMGACMCQRVLLTMPEIFAAGGATGGVLKGGFFGYFDSPGVVEGYKMPLWIILGENDRGGGDFKTNEKARANIEYWTRRDKTAPWDESCDYADGLYQNKVYHDEDGVPLVRFTTVRYKPHTSIPQDSWFFYDEFFSKFSRNEHGEVVYMNSRCVKNV